MTKHRGARSGTASGNGPSQSRECIPSASIPAARTSFLDSGVVAAACYCCCCWLQRPSAKVATVTAAGCVLLPAGTSLARHRFVLRAVTARGASFQRFSASDAGTHLAGFPSPTPTTLQSSSAGQPWPRPPVRQPIGSTYNPPPICPPSTRSPTRQPPRCCVSFTTCGHCPMVHATLTLLTPRPLGHFYTPSGVLPRVGHRLLYPLPIYSGLSVPISPLSHLSLTPRTSPLSLLPTTQGRLLPSSTTTTTPSSFRFFCLPLCPRHTTASRTVTREGDIALRSASLLTLFLVPSRPFPSRVRRQISQPTGIPLRRTCRAVPPNDVTGACLCVCVASVESPAQKGQTD